LYVSNAGEAEAAEVEQLQVEAGTEAAAVGILNAG